MDRTSPTPAPAFAAASAPASTVPGSDPGGINVQRRRVLLAGLAGAGILAGCGGGDDGGNGSAPAAPPGGGLGATPPPTAPDSGTVRFQVSGRQILRNGQPWFARGMCYSPQPIGASFASVPFGDFFSDYWKPIIDRDIPRLRAMGTNSLRLYSTMPFEKIYDPASTRLSHQLFLDACHDAGMTVWVGFPIGAGLFDAQDATQLDNTRQGVGLLAEQVGQHPAVIGFILGNETNNMTTRANPAFWAWLDGLAAITKEKAPDKLTMTSLVDDMQAIVEAEGRTPHIDVFGVNAYRGTTTTGMGTLFSEYAARSTRPLLITEFGCPASGRDTIDPALAVQLPDRAAAQAEYIRTQWLDMIREENRAINSGGYVLAWSDEWWKSGSPAIGVQDTHQNANGNFPGGYDDEEWFGIHAISLNPLRTDPLNPVGPDGVHHPDVLTPRAAVDVLTALWNTGA